jgi:DNA-binding transcriptional LysR family regulator
VSHFDSLALSCRPARQAFSWDDCERTDASHAASEAVWLHSAPMLLQQHERPWTIFTGQHPGCGSCPARRGYGIALGRGPLVDAEIKSGQLVRLIDQSVPSGWCYWLVTMDADFQSQDVKTFRQWLLDELAEAQPGSKQKAAAENRLTLIRGNARRRVE